MTNEAKSTESEASETPAVESKGMSLRDALEVGTETAKIKEAASGERPSDNRSDRKDDGEKSLDRGEAASTQPDRRTEEKTGPKYQPPADLDEAEKADFLSLSPKGQEAAIRLHKSRRAKLEAAFKAEKDAEPYRKLSENVNPYLKALGVKDSPEVAIQKALAMWREFEDAPDPKAAAAAYLKAKGVEVPEGFLEKKMADAALADEKIAPLQKEIEALKMRQADDDRARMVETHRTAWNSFAQEKNAAGALKFPDISDTDSGLKLAGDIGSLVNNETPLSKDFIARAQARIPGLTYEKLYAEAYKYLGGRVDESLNAPAKPEQAQSHLAKSKRAASSVPGRGGSGTASGPVKKYKSNREALQAAVEYLEAQES